MLLTSNHCLYFRDLMESLSEVINKTSLIFTKRGISLVATDNVKVTHINLQIYPSFFTRYEIKKEKIELVVEINKLLKVFRCSSKEDVFTFKHEPEESYIRIEFLNK